MNKLTFAEKVAKISAQNLIAMELPIPVWSEALSDELGCRVDVLDCSTLSTGTHKIIKAERALLAVQNDPRPAILISSGNYARAVKYLAEIQRRKVIIVMVGDADKRREFDSEMVETVDINELIAIYGEEQKHSGMSKNDLLSPGLQFAYNAYKGKKLPKNSVVNITNFEDIEEEEEFKVHKPLYGGLNSSVYSKVFCPNGSGELLNSLIEGGERYTRFYGISPVNHPAITGREFTVDSSAPSLADKLTTPTFPIEYSHISWLRDRRDILYSAITEEEIAEAHNIALRHGFNAEPSASVSLSVLLEGFRERHRINFESEERILVVLTGNGRKPLY